MGREGERKKKSALDITQHNNGTAAHYFQRLVAPEQLSTGLSGRSRWKEPLEGAASGSPATMATACGTAGDRFSLMVHSEAAIS